MEPKNLISNYKDVYVRDVSVGLIRALENKVSWVNRFSDENVLVSVPIYLDMTGSGRFLLDAFVDDTPGKRVELNTDVKQRLMVTPESWTMKSNELSNPNTWIDMSEDVGDEIINYFAKVKIVPTNFKFVIKARLDVQLDAWRMWESIVDNLFLYRYFHFTHKGLRIRAIFTIPDDGVTTVPREFSLTDNNMIEFSMEIEVNTIKLIFEDEFKIPANKRVQWNLDVYDLPKE